MARSSGRAAVRRSSSCVVGTSLAEPGQRCRRRPRSRHQTCLRGPRPARRASASALEVRGRLHDQRPGAGVGEDPLDLLRGGGLVDRHGDRAGEPDRVVEQGPLVAGARQQRDPVAGADAGSDQSLGDRGHLGEELRGGDVAPAVVGADGENATVSACSVPLAHDVVGEVARARGRVRRRAWRTRARLTSTLQRSSRTLRGRLRAGQRTSGRLQVGYPPRQCNDHRRVRAMAEQTTSSIVIAADPAAVMAVIADFAAYPAWAQGMKKAETVEPGRGRAGRAGLLRARRRPDQGHLHAGLRLARRRRRSPGRWSQGKMLQGHGRRLRARRPRRRQHRGDLPARRRHLASR